MLRRLLTLVVMFNVIVFGVVFADTIKKVRESTVIYKLKDDATPAQLKKFNALLNKSNTITKKELKGSKVNVVKVKNIKGFEKEFSKKLLDTGAVKFAELDALISPDATPNDLHYNVQWHHTKINSPLAWDSIQGSDIVKVCVLDTGVDSDHPDLLGNLLLPGYNAYLKVDGNIEDIYGHGSGTAGVIGAVGNNGIGVAGMTWNIKIIPVQINQGNISSSAYISDMAVGIEWCANQGAKVANLSYGGAQYATISEAAQYLRDRGGLLFMSAGNDGTNNSIEAYPDYSSFVVVGSTNLSDVKSDFSEYGPFIDVVAPGESIATTYNDGGYVYYTGTSFSSPMTAGLAALIYAINPDFTPAEVENCIFNTASDLGVVGDDDLYGHGRIDAGFAVTEALNYLSPNNPPVAVATSNITGGTAPLNVTFDGSQSTDSDGDITSYIWSFGDGNQGSGVTTEHLYEEGGSFHSTLTVIDNRAAQATSTPIVIDVEPNINQIDTPTDLVAVVDETLNSVTLNWVHNLVNTSSFEIYKAKKVRGKYTFSLLTTTQYAINSYIDTEVDANSYKYKIRAKGLNPDIYSEYSNEVFVKVETSLPTDPTPEPEPEPDPTLLAPNLSIAVSGKDVNLSWTHSCPEDGACTYYVKKASKATGRSDFSYTYEGITTNSLAITEEVGTYYYKVYAIFNQDSSDYSNIVTARIK